MSRENKWEWRHIEEDERSSGKWKDEAEREGGSEKWCQGGDRVKEWDTLGLYQSITEGAPSLMSVILCYSTRDDSTDLLVQCGGHNLVELNIHSHPLPFVLDSVLLFHLLYEFPFTCMLCPFTSITLCYSTYFRFFCYLLLGLFMGLSLFSSTLLSFWLCIKWVTSACPWSHNIITIFQFD